MSAHNLGAALSAYRNALASTLAGHPLQEKDILQLLNARDALQLALAQVPAPGVYALQTIQTLDRQLKVQAPKLAAQFDFSAYRSSFPKPPDQWWWWLESSLETSSSDWAFKGLTTLAWAISIGLLVNISGRFLLGGAGVAGLSAVALSNLLALIKAKNDLTEAGNIGLTRFLKRLKLSKPQQLRAKCGTTALLAGALFLFWLSLPSISNGYNRRGQTAQQQGKLGSAEQNYNQAIALNPDNVSAHYNLGTLYEDIQELDKAETEYLIAIRGNFPEAFNNLARLYLQSPKTNLNKAVALLNQGLKLADEQQSYPETQYSLYKNLGWALFQQDQHGLAQSALEAAIAISEQPDVQPYVNNRGSAYCLLAQTLEAQGENQNLPIWQQCCQLGNIGNPEENSWLVLARQRIEANNLDYNEQCKATATPLSSR